jgi:putative transposase
LIQETIMPELSYIIEIPIICKWCGDRDIKKYGTRKGVQEYLCLKCGRKFINKDAPYRKQSSTDQIGRAITSYYDGLSFGDIARQIEVNESTIYRWLISYTKKILKALEPLKPKVSNTWVVDETVLKIVGDNMWFWDVIDEDTRFLLASHLSSKRTILDVAVVMRKAWKKADKAPKFIVSDGMAAYPDGIERIFGAYSKNIRAYGLTDEINTNLIERFHGTVKDRTKVLRGFKTIDTAVLILNGFLVHYNFFRPHISLDMTPAEAAKLKVPFKTWTDFVAQDKGDT